MAGSTFQPPINLDPHQDPAQQTAFINQNFQSLAAVLETNSFRIAKSGTVVINRPSSANDFAVLGSATHNLGYIPAVVAYIIPPGGYASGLKNIPLPFFDYSLFDSGNPASTQGWHINGLADITTVSTSIITFRLSFVIGSGGQVGDWTYKYYLLQETAT